MTWFKLDDQFHSNQKVIVAGNAAIGLYCRLGTYCADKLTDGFIATAIAASMGTKAELRALTTCPIPDMRPLLAVVDGGYQIVDFLEYNPTREQVLAERDKARERMASFRSRSADVRANKRANIGRSSDAPVPVPDPTEYISDNSTPENTPPAGDISSRHARIADRYGVIAVRLARLKGIVIADDSAYSAKARKRIGTDPELRRIADLFPTAPDDVIAAALHGEKHSLGGYPRADDEIEEPDQPTATVHQFPRSAAQ